MPPPICWGMVGVSKGVRVACCGSEGETKMGVPQSHSCSPQSLLPFIPPYPYTATAPSLVSTNIYFISLTFSLGLDEVATVWWRQRLVCDYNAFYFVLAIKQFTHIS